MKCGLVAAGCSILVACGPGSGVETPSEAASAARDRGELLSLACQACHTLAPGGDHLIGPNLAGVFGRAAGTASGFENYSDALRQSGIIWSPTELDRWLANPAGFLPGTTMAFAGYQSAADRAALVAYLIAATGRTSGAD